jgi:hypothetical protein
MSNSQKWAVWIVVAAILFLIAAFVGSTWLFVAVYVLVRLAASTAVLVIMAGVMTGLRRKAR